MATHPICPECGKSIAPGAPGCPSCLIALAMPAPRQANRDTTALGGPFYAPRPDELEGLFPQLKIIELLGHGGMGAVYRARQNNLDRQVALKILSPRLNEDPSFAERFTREARTMAKLSHPNIVTVFDFGQAGDMHYLIMELIDGVNLRDAIQSGSVSPEQALAIVPQVCEALQYAHDEGVIHRDIKPENILLGKKDVVKIADFGLAKLLDPASAEFTLTGTQQILGTRNYMAPEQIEKPTRVDHRADIYSLGVVFYELLTGELPLGRFSLPSEKAAVSGQLDDVVMRTLEKEPDRRYQQASQVKTAVETLGRAAPQKNLPPAKPPRALAEFKVTVPFKITDMHGGFSESLGIARFDGKQLELEFQINTMGVSKSPTQRVQITANDILFARMSNGVFSDRIEIQTDRLEAAEDVPTANQGQIRLTIRKKDSDLAEAFVARVNEFAGQGSQGGAATDTDRLKDAKPTVEETSLAFVPFKIANVHGGFAEAFGIANLTQNNIVVEFEIHDGFGVTKSAPKKVKIPLRDIVSIRFDARGVTSSDRIEIQTDRIESAAQIPTSTQGRFCLRTKKKDREMADDLVAHALALKSGGKIQARQRSGGADDALEIQQVQRRLRWPARGMMFLSLLNLIVFVISASSYGLWSAGWWPPGLNLRDGVASALDNSAADDPDPGTIAISVMDMAIGNPYVGAVTILSVFFASVLFFATAHLIGRQKHYHFVLAVAVVALLPVHTAFIVGVPVGLWALIVLGNGKVRSRFDRHPTGRATSSPTAKPMGLADNHSQHVTGELTTAIRAAVLFVFLLVCVLLAGGLVLLALLAPSSPKPSEPKQPTVDYGMVVDSQDDASIPGSGPTPLNETVPEKLRRIAVSVLNYEKSHNRFPCGDDLYTGVPRAPIRPGDRSAETSDSTDFLDPSTLKRQYGFGWSLSVVPFLGEIELWDSLRRAVLSHDQAKVSALLGQPMPYFQTRADTPDGSTTLATIAFEGSALGAVDDVSMEDLTDGPENTVLFVEVSAEFARPWWEGQSLPFDEATLGKLGRADESFFYAGMGDGTVRRIKKDVDLATLRGLLTIAGGETIDWSLIED